MKVKIIQLLQFIRYKNLLLVLLTQALTYHCLVRNDLISIPDSRMLLLVLGTVLIAAAGYMINDYYDVETDMINKPNQVFVGKIFRPKRVIAVYSFFNLVGFAIGFSLSLELGFLFILTWLVLFIYAARFKKSLLMGNVLVSITLAATVVVVWILKPGENILYLIIYTAFAFITGMIREIIKDMEDIDGDAKTGCRSFPIVFGIPKTKTLIKVFIYITFLLLLLIIRFTWYLPHYWLFTAYLGLFVLFPLGIVHVQLDKTQHKEEFENLTRLMKIAITTGLLSMIFFGI